MPEEKQNRFWRWPAKASLFLLGILIPAVVTLWGPDIKNQISGKDEVERVVTLLEPPLNHAARGRKRLDAIAVEVNNCRLPPDRAAAQVETLVAPNRKAVLEDLSGLDSASDSEAQTLVSAFRAAIRAAQRADEKYMAWLRAWPEPTPRACPPDRGLPWHALNDENASATEAKSKFLESYNRAAEKYDRRHDWTHSNI